MQAPPCIVVRTHNPTVAQIERMGEWYRALMHTEFELYVSVDVTAPAGLATVGALCTRIPQARIHTYTEAEMVHQYYASMSHFVDASRFPGGAGAKRVYAERRAQGCSLAWGMHVEPICLWAHAVGWRFSHVWVCEDDIGFSGDLPAFLRAYAHDPADVVTNMASQSSAFKAPQVKCGVVVRPGSGWFWHDTCTPAYARQVPSHERFKTSEHLNRLSQRLVRELDRLSRTEGVSAWSEQFFISIALQRERGFTVSLFRPEHIGSPYQWNGRVSARDWNHICREDRAAAIGAFQRSYLLPSMAAMGYAMPPVLLPPVPGGVAAGAAAAAAQQSKRRRIEFSWPLGPQDGQRALAQAQGIEGRIYHVRARARAPCACAPLVVSGWLRRGLPALRWGRARGDWRARSHGPRDLASLHAPPLQALKF